MALKKETASFTAGCIVTALERLTWQQAVQGKFLPLDEGEVSPTMRSQYQVAEFFVSHQVSYRGADRTLVLAFYGNAILLGMGTPHAANTDSKREKMSAAVRAYLGMAPADHKMSEAEDDLLDAMDNLSFAISKYVRGDSAQI